MAKNLTAITLITMAQQAVDMEDDSSIDDTEWKQLLATAYGEMHNILVESGHRYFESTSAITGDGSASYSLPADFLTLVGIDRDSDGQALLQLMAQDRSLYRNATGDSQAYSFSGANVKLFPAANTGNSYTMTYVPQPTVDSSIADGTNVDVVTTDGEAFIVWHMANRALVRDQDDPRDVRREREEARGRFTKWAQLRALNDTMYMAAPQGDLAALDIASWYNRG